MTYCYASGILENRPNIRAMHLIDELFMFLVRIKLGLFQQDLAHRFNLHISSVSRKITTWANYLYFLGGSQTIWPPGLMCLPKCQGNLRNTTQVHVLSWIAQRFLLRHHHLSFCNFSCILHIRVTQL